MAAVRVNIVMRMSDIPNGRGDIRLVAAPIAPKSAPMFTIFATPKSTTAMTSINFG